MRGQAVNPLIAGVVIALIVLAVLFHLHSARNTTATTDGGVVVPSTVQQEFQKRGVPAPGQPGSTTPTAPMNR